jgi:hypothetical protein
MENGVQKNATSTASFSGVLATSQTFNGVTSTSATYKIGEVLSITVTDRDANLDAAVVDSVRVAASMASDRETVLLAETGTSTGVFTGLLTTNEDAATVVGDGRISPVASGRQVLCFWRVCSYANSYVRV